MHPTLHRQLSAVDWDFVIGDEALSAGLHWYPGTFVPGLPAAIIEALSAPGDLVLDPYGGVGTTGLAAVTRGRRAICCDLNPVAALASFVGVCLLSLRLQQRQLYEAVFEEVELIVDAAADTQSSLSLRGKRELRSIDRYISTISDRSPEEIWRRIVTKSPAVEPLRPWYEPKTLLQLIALVERASAQRGSYFVQLVSLAMTSAVARQLSSQTRSWGHVADNVLPKVWESKDVKRAALNWLKRTYNRFNQVSARAPLPTQRPFFSLRVIDWSSDSPVDLEAGSARLLVTSPPYAGAIDYTLAQRLSLHLLGYDSSDIAQLCGREMGARRKRFVSSHISTWASELCSALRLQTEVLSETACAAFVMPHKDHGRDLGEEQLKKFMTDQEWVLVFERDRSIRQIKARQSWTSIKRETVLIFERSGGN